MSELLNKENKIGYKGFSVDENNRLYCSPCDIPYFFEVNKDYKIKGRLEMCGNGFHFCWQLNDIHNFYNLSNSVICEIEILGEILNDSDMKKSCASHIKILRILTREEVLKISNLGNDNTGFINTGNRNTGNRNTGDGNIGNRNTGNWNTGDWNTGEQKIIRFIFLISHQNIHKKNFTTQIIIQV